MNEPLPIDPLLPEVRSALRQHGVLLLMAPPGSGKTTRVPPALLADLPQGDLVVLEPRRLAARAAANRVAQETGGELGGLVGYQVRGERRVGPKTRIRFVTEGVLVRQLVKDPFLDGVACVLLDEFHERHLEGDLALAMLAESRATVRPDLRLGVMSATLDPAPLLQFLPGCARLEADGRLFPVQVVHEAQRDDSALDLRVRALVDRALQDTAGDVLVFLPGQGEIMRCEDALQNLARRHGVLLTPLHGRLDPRAQDLAIQPQRQRKVVLSTNVAESSLTIPGVTAVIDTGLQRVMRHDRGRGVDVLSLERISLASAVQRTGRAGRTGPGVCYRLWTAGEERGMPAHEQPEIRRVDLCAPALLVRAFAGRDPAQFGWFEAPPAAALQGADALLQDLGAVGKDGMVTRIGEELLTMPLHPRLGRVVVEGRKRHCRRSAATAAAVLSELDDLGRGDGADVLLLVDWLSQAQPRDLSDGRCRELGIRPGAARGALQTRDRLLGAARDRDDDAADVDAELGKCLLAGFPDRVALRGGADKREALMVGGRGVVLPRAADGQDLVLALALIETGRQSRSLVPLFTGVLPEWLAEVEPQAIRSEVTAEIDAERGRAVAVRQTLYRDLPLKQARGGELPLDRAQQLLLPLLQQDPWRWLGEAKDLRRLCARLAWLHERMPEAGLPGGSDAEVAAAAAQLLTGSDLQQLRSADVGGMLLAGLSQAQRGLLSRHAPDRIELPTGRAAVVDYSAPAGPTVSARLQEFFGLRSVQALANGRVPVVLELLAPNHRPVQVTTDLPSFWTNVYPQVRRELSRRYPRHSWPEDPLLAQPQARPQRRPPR